MGSSSSELEFCNTTDQRQAIDFLADMIFKAHGESKDPDYGERENRVYVNGVGGYYPNVYSISDTFFLDTTDVNIANKVEEAEQEISIIEREASHCARTAIEQHNLAQQKKALENKEAQEKRQREADLKAFEDLKKKLNM